MFKVIFSHKPGGTSGIVCIEVDGCLEVVAEFQSAIAAEMFCRLLNRKDGTQHDDIRIGDLNDLKQQILDYAGA